MNEHSQHEVSGRAVVRESGAVDHHVDLDAAEVALHPARSVAQETENDAEDTIKHYMAEYERSKQRDAALLALATRWENTALAMPIPRMEYDRLRLRMCAQELKAELEKRT